MLKRKLKLNQGFVLNNSIKVYLLKLLKGEQIFTIEVK